MMQKGSYNEVLKMLNLHVPAPELLKGEYSKQIGLLLIVGVNFLRLELWRESLHSIFQR